MSPLGLFGSPGECDLLIGSMMVLHFFTVKEVDTCSTKRDMGET